MTESTHFPKNECFLCVIKNTLVICFFQPLPQSYCCSAQLPSPPPLSSCSYRGLQSYSSHCSSSSLLWPEPEDGSGTWSSRPGSLPGRCHYGSSPHCSHLLPWSGFACHSASKATCPHFYPPDKEKENAGLELNVKFSSGL